MKDQVEAIEDKCTNCEEAAAVYKVEWMKENLCPDCYEEYQLAMGQ